MILLNLSVPQYVVGIIARQQHLTLKWKMAPNENEI